MDPVNALVDTIKDMIEQEINKTDQLELCIVQEKVDEVHYNLLLVSDQTTVIKNIINMTRFDLNIGDYCYINKIGNKINNSFICYVYNPQYKNSIAQDVGSQAAVGGGGGGEEPEPPQPVPPPEPEPVEGLHNYYTPFMLRDNPFSEIYTNWEDQNGYYAPSYSKYKKTWCYPLYLNDDSGGVGKNTCIIGYPSGVGFESFKMPGSSITEHSVLSNCHGYSQGRYCEIYNEICGDYNNNIIPELAGISKEQAQKCDVYYDDPSLFIQDYSKNIRPGSMIFYELDSGGRHTAIVEKVLEVNGQNIPTVLRVSRSAFRGTCVIGWSDSKREQKWQYNDYKFKAALANPAVKQYQVDKNSYVIQNYIYKLDTTNMDLISLFGTSLGGPSPKENFSITVKFSLPSGDISGKRFLLLGNYAPDVSDNILNLEVKDSKLRLYASCRGTTVDKSLNFTLSGGVIYCAKVFWNKNDKKYSFYITDSNERQTATLATVTDTDTISHLCLFYDRRDSELEAFSQDIKYYWIKSISNINGTHEFGYNDSSSYIWVPCADKRATTVKYGFLDYCHNSPVTSNVLGGSN